MFGVRLPLPGRCDAAACTASACSPSRLPASVQACCLRSPPLLSSVSLAPPVCVAPGPTGAVHPDASCGCSCSAGPRTLSRCAVLRGLGLASPPARGHGTDLGCVLCERAFRCRHGSLDCLLLPACRAERCGGPAIKPPWPPRPGDAGEGAGRSALDGHSSAPGHACRAWSHSAPHATSPPLARRPAPTPA